MATQEFSSEICVGEWVELEEPVSMMKIDSLLGGEFLRRWDRIKTKNGEELIFTGGSVAGGEKYPEKTIYFFWPGDITKEELANSTERIEKLPAASKTIGAYYLQPGKVIVHFSVDPIMPEVVRKICRQRGQTQLTAEYL